MQIFLLNLNFNVCFMCGCVWAYTAYTRLCCMNIVCDGKLSRWWYYSKPIESHSELLLLFLYVFLCLLCVFSFVLFAVLSAILRKATVSKLIKLFWNGVFVGIAYIEQTSHFDANAVVRFQNETISYESFYENGFFLFPLWRKL